MSWKSLCTKWLPLLESKDIEIEQLKKENEWLLLELYYNSNGDMDKERAKAIIIYKMQQALKEK